MASKARIQKIKKLLQDLSDGGKDVPLEVRDIDPFPVDTFADLQSGVRLRQLKVYRFAYAMEPSLMRLFGSAAASAKSAIGLMLFLGTPFIAIVAGFVVSWWWLALLPVSLVGMRLSKTAYDSTILKAAVNNESAFCLLYWTKQVAVWDDEAKVDYYKKSKSERAAPAQPVAETALKYRSTTAPDKLPTSVRITSVADPVSDDDETYHPDLDKLVSLTLSFLSNRRIESALDWPHALHAESIAFAACCVARRAFDKPFSLGSWNTFKRSVENRMLSVEKDQIDLGGRSDGKTLVSYVSGYHKHLSDREALAAAKVEASEALIKMLADDVGLSNELPAFTTCFRSLVQMALSDVVPKAWRVFQV
jgi:hypothetical protein